MLAAMLALVPAGCNGSRGRPALGQVHGRVTLDGKPLARARILFRPDSGVRESTGLTDADGKYVLKYIRDDLGGAVGKNSVRITKQRTPDPESEILPERYNRQTTLTADVESGDNEINFDLTSQLK